jgi:rSAM/selenodomain-associated transferase 2
MSKKCGESMQSLSIIIPTLNESERIASLIEALGRRSTNGMPEVIVVDGGSTDGTPEAVARSDVRLVRLDRAGRAIQLNAGAAKASGDILFFLHADCMPPAGYDQLIMEAIRDDRTFCCFPYRFDTHRHFLQKWQERMTWRKGIFSGGGDQGLAISRKMFDELGGYRDDYPIMEDFELVKRAKKKGAMRILPAPATVSARKYAANNYWRIQLVHAFVFTAFTLGVSPLYLRRIYTRTIRR